VIAVLRDHRITVTQEPDSPEFFELVRDKDVQVMRLPDIVHYETLLSLQFRYGIATSKFTPEDDPPVKV
jgi:hypothetical protein